MAFRDFTTEDGCLYCRHMREFYGGGANAMWRELSKYYLDLMDNLVALASPEKTVYRGPDLSGIALR